MNSGGGSGGSILINVTTLEGEGAINASGGDGNGNGGGGSGGRIAVYFYNSAFTGTVTAMGGRSSFEAGAAGTIYRVDVKRNLKYLLVSNGNRAPRSSVVTDFIHPVSDSARTWLPLIGDKRTEKYAFDEGICIRGPQIFQFSLLLSLSLLLLSLLSSSSLSLLPSLSSLLL